MRLNKMRLQPPKTRKTKFKGDEIKDYFLDHVVVENGDIIPVLEFLQELVEKYKDPYESLYKFLELWPTEYQDIAAEIFGHYVEKYSKEY